MSGKSVSDLPRAQHVVVHQGRLQLVQQPPVQREAAPRRHAAVVRLPAVAVGGAVAVRN